MRIKYILISCLMILTITSLYFLKNRDRDSTRPIEKKRSQKTLKSLLVMPREEISTQHFPMAEAISPYCEIFWKDLQRLDLRWLVYPPTVKSLPNVEKCVAPAPLRALHEYYKDKCAAYMDMISVPETEAIWNQQSEACMIALYFLRAKLSAENHKEKALSDITDLQLLADRLVSTFSGLFVPGAEVTKITDLREVGERILQIDKNLYGAAKVVLFSDIMQATADAQFHSSEDFWRQAETHLDRARRLNAQDLELDQMARIIRTRGFDPERVREEAREMLDKNPNAAEAYYYIGYAAWKTEQKEEALSALKRAMELDSDNKAYQRTWSAVQAPDANKDSFQITFQFGMELDKVLE